MQNFRVDQLDILLAGIDDHDPAQNADLRPREADAVGVVHGLEHVVEERRQTVVKFCDRAAFFCQNRVSHRYDLSQCHTGILLII